MATIKRLFIFLTSVLSGIATLFIIVALSTEQWIQSSEVEYTDGTTHLEKYNVVKYGLFQGTVEKQEPSHITLVLSSKLK